MPEEQSKQVVSEQPEKLSGEAASTTVQPSGGKFYLVCITALGIVFGDIGTSPLYALKECFYGRNPIPLSASNVMGVLSLIFWSLVLVISVKYLAYIVRADNEGEGGILALTAIVSPWHKKPTPVRLTLLAVGVLGACLLYGDAMITPAISVLGAVQGLRVATSAFDRYIVPIAAVILVLLFMFQKRGTTGVGRLFGPVMVVWFVSIAALGIAGIVRQPGVIGAVNPLHALRFFQENGWHGFLVLGAVFLVVTGGEALYADLGHFTRRSIRFAWFVLVLPSLLLNYFGQGAVILATHGQASQPFYNLVPGPVLYPMVALSTLATIIASQAVISGAYSLTRQAALLGLLPRVQIVQTSSEHIGQIYVPIVSWVMMIGTEGMVLGFQSTRSLAAAYGVAVSTTMVITTLLALWVALDQWHWHKPAALLVTAGFLAVDLSFFGANLFRIVDGGWLPLFIGASVFAMMWTWRRGRKIVGAQIRRDQVPSETFIRRLADRPPVRVPGTSVFMSSNAGVVPLAFLHNLRFNHVVHEQVVFLNVIIEDFPRVHAARRMEIKNLADGIFEIILHFGFMENPNVPRVLKSASANGLNLNMKDVMFYIGGQRYIPTDDRPRMAAWREKLFTFMVRNAALSIAFYGLPPERVLELNKQIRL